MKLKTNSGTILDSLHVKEIEKLRCILPSHDSIKLLDNILNPINDYIEINNEINKNLNEIKKLIIPLFISGIIRIFHKKLEE